MYSRYMGITHSMDTFSSQPSMVDFILPQKHFIKVVFFNVFFKIGIC